jgi:hypothetical protein
MSDSIKKNVKALIASCANLNAADIADHLVLKESPLYFDDTSLVSLALTLRGYVKSMNPAETIVVDEIKKKNFTVEDVYELIKKKLAL